MANRSDSLSLPPAVRRVAVSFLITGWISFWAQIVLAAVSTIVLAFAGLNSGAAPAPTTPNTVAAPNAGTGFGVFFAVCGLAALFAGAYWAFRYTRLSKRLKIPDAQARPKRGDAIQALRIGLLINLIGMLLTLLGAQAIVGSLVAKSLAQGFALFSGTFPQFIRPLDIFIVQANTNTIMAHFIGLIATLWLIRSINRQ